MQNILLTPVWCRVIGTTSVLSRRWTEITAFVGYYLLLAGRTHSSVTIETIKGAFIDVIKSAIINALIRR